MQISNPHIALLSTLAIVCTATPALAQQPATINTTPVTLNITPKQATVTLNGKEISQRTLALPPGKHTFTITAQGYITRQETINLEAQAGREILMSINLSKEPPQADTSMRSEGIVDHMAHGRPITGWIMTAAGVALVTTSIILAVRQSNHLANCRDLNRCEDAPAPSGWTTTTAALGGASILGGITLLSWKALAGESSRSAQLQTKKTWMANITVRF